MTRERLSGDHEERQRAIDTTASCIVQAPAGSGKTELLIQRFLALLATVDHPEEVVAITFTNKAAGEMRARIVLALAQAGSGVEPADMPARATFPLAQAVLARNLARGWRLSTNPGRLRVLTVDAFCAALTRQMPLLARLGAQPETVDDPEPLYREAAARTLAMIEDDGHVSGNVATLLAYLDNDLPRTRDLLAAMLRRRDQWLRHMARGVDRQVLEGALARLIESSLAGLRRALPEQEHDELLALLAYAVSNLQQEGAASDILACRDPERLPGIRHGEREPWLGIAELLLTRAGDWRATVNKRQGFPASHVKGRDHAVRMKDRLLALIGRLSGHTALRMHLQELRFLPPPHYSDGEWQIADALSTLLLMADAQLRVVFSERNQIDFMGIALAAITALEVDDAPTDLALHLDYRIRHLLVDEFQDISINQYALLHGLTAGWSPDDGHTLFLVGDPMQSIYRFREAEVGKFLDTWQERRLGQVPLTALRLRVNFRSQPGIVRWVNEVFAGILPEQPDIARGAVSFSAAEACAGRDTGADDGRVSICPQLGRSDGDEADAVLRIIGECTAAPADGSVAILVRNRSHLVEIVARLRGAGIAFRAVDIDPLGALPVIQDLLALTRALHHLADRIAWLAVLRAPWCGLTLPELLCIAGGNDGDTIWQRVQDDSVWETFGQPARARLLRVREVMQSALAQRCRWSASRWVEAAWVALGGPATLRTDAEMENARAFFDLLAGHETAAELDDMHGLEAAVAELFAAPDPAAPERLQIMTIHKAKGLEFDTVILPGLGRGTRSDEPALLLWDERAREDGGQDLLLAPIRQLGEEQAPVYNCLRYFESQRRRNEEGRLLYVAVTRARRRLVLLGHTSVAASGETAAPRSDSLLAHLWQALCPEFERAGTATAAPVPAAAGVVVAGPSALRRLPPDWQRPPLPTPCRWQPVLADRDAEVVPEFDWAGESIRHAGIVYHRAMQRIAADGLEQWDADRIHRNRDWHLAQLRQKGIAGEDLEAAAALVQEALLRTLDDDTGRWILSATHDQARSEYALTGVHAGKVIRVVIDRTFVDAEGQHWVVDYKTSRHQGPDLEAFLGQQLQRYREQLLRYRGLMGARSGRAIRAALYFPLHSRLVELMEP